MDRPREEMTWAEPRQLSLLSTSQDEVVEHAETNPSTTWNTSFGHVGTT